MGKFDDRLNELGIELPDAAAPAANYVPFVRDGDTLYVSGQVPRDENGMIVGKLGDTYDVEQATDSGFSPGAMSVVAQRPEFGRPGP